MYNSKTIIRWITLGGKGLIFFEASMLPDTMADSIFELASSNPDFLIVDETDKLLFWDHLVGLISLGELEPLYL